MEQSYIMNIGISMCIFYLLISSNFIGELYNVKLQEILHNNLYIKHILGYITLLTAIIFVNTKKNNLLQDIRNSLVIYILFIMSTKNNPRYFLLSFLSIFIAYIIDKINQIYIKDKKTKKSIKELVQYLVSFGLIITIYGFIKAYIKKQKKYGFNLHKFIFTKLKK